MTNSVISSTPSMPNSAQSEESQFAPLMLRRLKPGYSDRALFVGQTGSGKTTLARRMLDYRTWKVVLDYKGRIDWPEYTLCKTLKTLIQSGKKALLYRPDFAEAQDEDAQNRFWEFIYRRGNTTAYADEVTTFAQGDVFPFHFANCLVRGRELGVETWCATQRPMRIPQIVLSESEHNYVFALRLPQDRDRVEAFSGILSEDIARLQKRQFYYSRQDGKPAGPFTLKLS